MTISYNKAAIVVRRRIILRTPNPERSYYMHNKDAATKTEIVMEPSSAEHPENDRVIFNPSDSLRQEIFTGAEIKGEKCKKLGIGWSDPYAQPGRDYTPPSRTKEWRW